MSNAKYLFQISTSSGVPIYRQIMDQVKLNAATGRLTPDDYLPSVRQMASELAVNPMTVSKAYSLLEKEGVLDLVRGQGMRLRTAAVDLNQGQIEQEIIALMRPTVNKAKQLSLTKSAVLRIFNDLWKEDHHE